MNELSRKAETAITKVTERAKPTFVTIGKRQVISSGRWNNDLMADYVCQHGRSKWLPVGELASCAYGQNIMRSKALVRKSLHTLFKSLLLRGEVLVIEYGPPNNRAQRVKLFDAASQVDWQATKLKVARLRRRQELTAEQYDRAISLLEEKELGVLNG